MYCYVITSLYAVLRTPHRTTPTGGDLDILDKAAQEIQRDVEGHMAGKFVGQDISMRSTRKVAPPPEEQVCNKGSIFFLAPIKGTLPYCRLVLVTSKKNAWSSKHAAIIQKKKGGEFHNASVTFEISLAFWRLCGRTLSILQKTKKSLRLNGISLILGYT